MLSLKRYNLNHEAVVTRIEALLNTDGIVIKPADLSANISAALKLYLDHNIDYTDAYIASWMQNHDIDAIYTFNIKHFKRIKRLIVKEPHAD